MTESAAEATLREVLAADARRIEALLAGDAAALAALLDDDYTHVETNGGARDRSQFLALVSQPGLRFVSWIVEENRVRLYGDTAVVTGRYRNVVRTQAGEQPEKRARHVRVWVLRDGAWRNVAHQATAIPAG